MPSPSVGGSIKPDQTWLWHADGPVFHVLVYSSQAQTHCLRHMYSQPWKPRAPSTLMFLQPSKQSLIREVGSCRQDTSTLLRLATATMKTDHERDTSPRPRRCRKSLSSSPTLLGALSCTCCCCCRTLPLLLHLPIAPESQPWRKSRCWESFENLFDLLSVKVTLKDAISQHRTVYDCCVGFCLPKS